MVAPLQEYFASVEAADVHDYGCDFDVKDYLFGHLPDVVDWTVMNPPFRLAAQFIERALHTSDCGAAVFVRNAFLEGEERYRTLFSETPPTAILQFAERVVIHKGVMRQKGSKYIDGQGIERSASSATAYCWIVWEPEMRATAHQLERPPELHWVPPCRVRLERSGDYDVRGPIDE